MPEKENGKSPAGIYPDPLAGDRKAHEYTGSSQIRQYSAGFFPEYIRLYKPQHKEVCKYDKKHGEAVDCSNLRLCQMHAVECHQGTHCSSDGSAFR